MSSQPSHIDVSIHLRELGERVVDNVFSLELGTILIEAVGDEHGNIVHPCVTRRSGQKDPAVLFRKTQELLRPLSRSDESLFVEDEEGVFDVGVLSDVLPGINSENPWVQSRLSKTSGHLHRPVVTTRTIYPTLLKGVTRSFSQCTR
jgi:hypothetical protein